MQENRLSSKNDNKQVPDGLRTLKAVADGYKCYIAYLKRGKQSGIESLFGTLELIDGDSLALAA